MSMDEWVAKFGCIRGDGFTGPGVSAKYAAEVARQVSVYPPPVGTYTARAGDWWVYGV